VLLTGSNGSGKTTVLRVIAALRENFSGWLRLQKALNKDQQAQDGLLSGVGLAAIEIIGFIDHPLWLFVASNEASREELTAIAGDNAVLVGEVRGALGRPSFIGKDDASLVKIKKQKDRLELGVDQETPLPNFMFLDAENRNIRKIASGGNNGKIYPETLYRWLVTYEPRDRMEGHIENMFQNVKLRDEKQFATIRNAINPFLGHKMLGNFDDNNRLPVQFGKKRTDTHFLDDLSSGEKQCVIMMFMVSRWLMHGGVVLIDEPDLHLHVSLQRHFIHELEKVVHAKGGQLIITSHSPTMWEEFRPRQSIDLEHGVMADVE
jgi:ABC-type lipoprotein export system ATPase subunit